MQDWNMCGCGREKYIAVKLAIVPALGSLGYSISIYVLLEESMTMDEDTTAFELMQKLNLWQLMVFISLDISTLYVNKD